MVSRLLSEAMAFTLGAMAFNTVMLAAHGAWDVAAATGTSAGFAGLVLLLGSLEGWRD